MKDTHRALLDFRKAMQLSPDNEYSSSLLYKVLIASGKFNDAIEGEKQVIL